MFVLKFRPVTPPEMTSFVPEMRGKTEITPLTKLGELAHHVCTHITSKQIELESPGWSGFVINSKPDQT